MGLLRFLRTLASSPLLCPPHCFQIRLRLSYSSCCCGKIHNKSSVRKDGFTVAHKLRVYDGGTGMVAVPWGHWSHGIHSQEVEDEGHGMVPTTDRVGLPTTTDPIQRVLS